MIRRTSNRRAEPIDVSAATLPIFEVDGGDDFVLSDGALTSLAKLLVDAAEADDVHESSIAAEKFGVAHSVVDAANTKPKEQPSTTQ